MAEAFNAYHKWLGIPLEDQPPDHYRLLAIERFESDLDVIEMAVDRQTLLLRTIKADPYVDLSQRMLNEVAAARVCLLNPQKKAAYDAGLREKLKAKQAAAAPTGRPATTNAVAASKTPSTAVAGKKSPAVLWGSLAAGGVVVAIGLGVVVMSGRSKPPEPTPVVTAAASTVSKTSEAPSTVGSPTPAVSAKVEKSDPEPSSAARQPVIPAASAGADTKPPSKPAPVLQTPIRPRDSITNSIGMTLALIPAGEFDMGLTEEEVDQRMREPKELNDMSDWYVGNIRSTVPRHHVRIARPYYLGICEVTQSEYEQVMGANPSLSIPQGADKAAIAGQDPRRFPVNFVSWEDAVAFCGRLSEIDAEQAARRRYRLPTEAEWEYACRAGTTTRHSFGDDLAKLEEHAWYRKNAGGQLHPVGQKPPNAWGLYDMHGNLWEWCADRWASDYYAKSPALDPPGPQAGRFRVVRGGGAWNVAAHCCSSFRTGAVLTSQTKDHGFRVACDLMMP